MKMDVLSGLLTCSTGRVRTEEVSLCSALFQSGQSGWFCKQANNLSYYRTLPALLFPPPFFSSEYVFAWNTLSFSLYQQPVFVMLRLVSSLISWLHSSRCVSTDCLSRFFTQGQGNHQHFSLICFKCPKSDVPMLDICIRLPFLKSISERGI